MSRERAAGAGVIVLAIGALFLLGGGRKKGSSQLTQQVQRSRKKERPAYLAARRADLTEKDLEALWRMVQSENPSASEATHVEMVWAVMNRAHHEGKSVRKLLMPDDKPSHQIGGRPPFSTWKPANKDGPLPSPADAPTRAEKWVNKDPVLDGAIEWFQPGQQDELVKQGAELRAKRDRGEQLTDHEKQIARYYKTAAQFRAERPGQSLGRVGPLEFFRAHA